ncbi:MAG: translation initiation factor IF-2 [bacterium]
MTVKNYADDVNLSIAEVLKECVFLDIKVTKAEDLLSEDDIIMLDNSINLISTDDEITFDEDEEIEEVVENIVNNNKLTDKLTAKGKKEKIKKKEVNTEIFKQGKKELYKNKSKLQKNNAEEASVLYKEGMSLYSLAELMQVNPADMIKKLIPLGIMIGINDSIDFDIASMLADEYKKVLKTEVTVDVSNFEEYEICDANEDLTKRPPVVTIMGHVDHGKTSLLDYIRKSKIATGEAGGITQAIGAYQIEYNGEKISFIDTPGHAAFTNMRARGASITDIVIVIVAADDGVMPQTREAIDHAKAAGVPIIVAVNKIDKPDANIEKVMTEMADANMTPESWGGEYPFINISAMTGEGIDYLLDNILAIAEVNEYKANPNRYAIGAVIESRTDKNVGGIGALLIQNGTLRIGDPLVVGTSYAKVRSMKNDMGESILEAGPSTPVEITGLSSNPEAGDKFMAFEQDSEAKKIATKRLNIKKEKEMIKKPVTLDDLFATIDDDNKYINIVLKADVKGSEEAVKASLEKINMNGVLVKVIRSGIGAVSEADISLASAGNAIVIGFNVDVNMTVKDCAKGYGVEIREYNIIYKLIEDLEGAMKGMLEPVFEEVFLGRAEIRKIFTFSKIGNIAGSYITDGKVQKGAICKIIRNEKEIGETKVASVQREKDTVKEVKKGYECGITISDFSDIQEKDILEFYEKVEVKF